MRPLENKDIVRILKTNETGVINRTHGTSVNIFRTSHGKNAIGIWYNLNEVKRIGRVKSK